MTQQTSLRVQTCRTKVHSLSQLLAIDLFEPTSRGVGPDGKEYPTFSKNPRASADSQLCFHQTGMSVSSAGLHQPVVCYLSKNIMNAPTSGTVLCLSVHLTIKAIEFFVTRQRFVLA